MLFESADGDDDPAEDDPPPGPLQVRREVRPPLRRWAAAELLRQRPERLDEVFARRQTLSARDAAAVVAGIIDAADALDDQRAQRLLEIGLGWPAGWVRLVALERLAGCHGLDAPGAWLQKIPMPGSGRGRRSRIRSRSGQRGRAGRGQSLEAFRAPRIVCSPRRNRTREPSPPSSTPRGKASSTGWGSQAEGAVEAGAGPEPQGQRLRIG